MKKGSGVSYLSEHPDARAVTSTDKLRAAIKDQSISLILEDLRKMFDGIDDSFFELANHANTNNEQNRLFEAMREIRIKRKGIESHIENSITEAFDHPKEVTTKKPCSPDIESEELCLIQNDTLENELAVDSMIAKAKADFSSSLMHFQERYSALMDCGEGSKRYNPLDPALLCKSFGKVCSELEIDIEEKLVVFKQFDQCVVEKIVKPLEKGNQVLAEAGYLPKLKYTAYKNESNSKPKEDLITADTLNQEQQENHPTKEDIFAEAQELLASLRTPPPADQKADPNTQNLLPQPPLQSSLGYAGPPIEIEAPELVSMLSGIQQSMHTDDLAAEPVTAVDLRSSIQNLLDEKAEKTERPTKIDQIDEDLINLVSMLFEFILDDYNLAAPVQVLLSRLQIPVLKVAIKDKSFFSKPSNPARKLLDALAKASISWGDASGKTKDKLYSKIHSIVREILDDEDCTLAFYEALYTDFNKYLEREERKAKLIEQRTKEAELGRIESQKAKLVVDRILYETISATAVPQVALDILKDGWSRLMFLVYLKEGRGHHFSQCVKIADEVVWCLQPHTEKEARQRWVQIAPKLLKSLKIGLKEISYNSGHIDELLLTLKKELTLAFKQQTITEPTDKETLEDLKAAIDQAKPKDMVTDDDSLNEYLAQIDKLQGGEWVEFMMINGSRFRCKFSACIDEDNLLIFVNRMGIKVIEKNRAELADDLRKGQVIILQSGKLMNRAIDSMMHNLKKMSSTAA